MAEIGGACGACGACGLRSSLSCSRCLAVFYCGPQHQRDHWQLHRPDCSALYHIHTSQELGRHLVAARDIKQGSVILKERAIVVIPFHQPKSQFLKIIGCPNCCGVLQSDMPSLWPQCRRCGVPLCSEDCKQVTAEASLHTDAECELLERVGVRDNLIENYRVLILGALRCLMLTGAKAKTLRSMVSHQNSQGTADIVGMSAFVMREAVGDIFSSEDVQFVEGAILTNSFQFEVPEYGSNSGALFSHISLIAHSCRPNARFSPFGRNKADITGAVIASEDISAGSMITIRYVNVLASTSIRRMELERNKNFFCRCERCEDPTEMGTHYGSICCPRCTELGKPLSVLQVTGWSSHSQWPCPACGFHMTPVQVSRVITEKLGAGGDAEDPEEIEDFLRTISYPQGIFHPTASEVVETKMNLLAAYGHYDGYSYKDLSVEMLQRKLDLCREVMQVLDLLTPGLSYERGQLLQEELETLIEMASRMLGNVSPAGHDADAQVVVENADGVFTELRRICIEPSKQRKLQELGSLMNHLKELTN